MPATVADIVAYCLDNPAVTGAFQAVSPMFSQSSSGKPLGPAHRGRRLRLSLGGSGCALEYFVRRDMRPDPEAWERFQSEKKGLSGPFLL